MQLVMFDIDGTLVESNGFDGELFAVAVEEVLGADVDRTWKSYRHVTDSGVLSEIIERQGVDFDPAFDAVRARFIQLISDYLGDPNNMLSEIPGASDLIAELRSIPDVAVAIATGGWRETAELKLSRAGINTSNIALATSSDAVVRTEIMRLAEQRASRGRAFTSKIYFGDGPWDQRASAELGYAFIGVGSNVEHPVRFENLQHTDEILSILFN